MSNRIENAHRITLVCYDPEGEYDGVEDLVYAMADKGVVFSDADMRPGIRCEHVADRDDGRLSPRDAADVFGR